MNYEKIFSKKIKESRLSQRTDAVGWRNEVPATFEDFAWHCMLKRDNYWYSLLHENGLLDELQKKEVLRNSNG